VDTHREKATHSSSQALKVSHVATSLAGFLSIQGHPLLFDIKRWPIRGLGFNRAKYCPKRSFPFHALKTSQAPPVAGVVS
jgi:hypothetical protein